MSPLNRRTRGPRRPVARIARGRGAAGRAARRSSAWSVVDLGMTAVLFAFQTRMIFPGAATQGTPGGRGRAAARDRAGPPQDRAAATASSALFGPALSPAGKPLPDAARRPTLLYFYGNGTCLRHAVDYRLRPLPAARGQRADPRLRRLRDERRRAERVGLLRDRRRGLRPPQDAPRRRPRADRRRRPVAGRRGRDRPGRAAEGRRAGRLQHVHPDERHGAPAVPVPARLAALAAPVRQPLEDRPRDLPDPDRPRPQRRRSSPTRWPAASPPPRRPP